jgi:hypothetical protein
MKIGCEGKGHPEGRKALNAEALAKYQDIAFSMIINRPHHTPPSHKNYVLYSKYLQFLTSS